MAVEGTLAITVKEALTETVGYEKAQAFVQATRDVQELFGVSISAHRDDCWELIEDEDG